MRRLFYSFYLNFYISNYIQPEAKMNIITYAVDQSRQYGGLYDSLYF